MGGVQLLCSTYANYIIPGRKSEALQLGDHLILLYFISISLLIPEIFVLFIRGWRVGGARCPTFVFFKSLDNNMVYSLGIDVYTVFRARRITFFLQGFLS